MYTQCSGCATVFRVSARHLRQARGLVRCCSCERVFNATTALLEALPAELEAHVRSPTLEHQEEAGQLAAAEMPPSHGSDDYFTSLPTTDAPEDESPLLPVKPAGMRYGAVGGGGLFMLLLCAAVVLYSYTMRDELSQYPRLRPWVESLCQVADCQLPLLQDVGQIQVLHKDAGMATDLADQLVVKAIIANGADYWQPYPQIRLRFPDSTGSVQATHWFSPDDYLGVASASDRQMGMPPQEPIAISLGASGLSASAQDNFIMDLR